MQDENCYGTEHQLAVKDDKGCRTYPLMHPTYEVGRFAKLDICLCTRSHLVARHHATLVQFGQPPFDYQLIASFSLDDSGAHPLLVNGNPI